ncbi:hypothetical protein VTJ83DRAFT_349 [Remersonia thermophila]|uniref:F-box domain-containing protein n=1 Tax=Remersonia thermophila TaxID=72144 RepID=A0ABR4DKU3_9PEZI
MTGLFALPQEILLYIFSYLDPPSLTALQLVSRRLLNLVRDDNLWRFRCLEESSFLATLDRRRGILGDGPPRPTERERIRIMANWDPSFPGERVPWYEEYVQRHGPIAVSWFQLPYPHHDDGNDGGDGDGDGDGTNRRKTPDAVPTEVCGLALYYPDGELGGSVLAVAPLLDGSVCLWDVAGTWGKRGAIVARSKPGLLDVEGTMGFDGSHPRWIETEAVECVSVDSQLHRAYFAVERFLVEVDLRRLAVVGDASFPMTLTVISPASPAVPLTVGERYGIHLYDPRSSAPPRDDSREVVETYDSTRTKDFEKHRLRRSNRDMNVGKLKQCARLSGDVPLSIVHLQQAGCEADLSDDIYVAGRFSSILHYDRRKFPAPRGSIHSGARLCTMTSLPYPFSTVDSELRRRGELSLEEVETSKLGEGRTLIAGGEYNTKGSLELYGLAGESDSDAWDIRGRLQKSTLKNRQTCSPSKVLSVACHGARIALSDGSGYIRWFERDGFTEVRRCQIGSSNRRNASQGENEQEEGTFVFASTPDDSHELARKLLPTRPAAGAAATAGGDRDGGQHRAANNDLVFWTGERLGLVTFSARPGFHSEDFEEDEEDEHKRAQERERREYSDRMRRALERQADEVRFMGSLGLDM